MYKTCIRSAHQGYAHTFYVQSEWTVHFTRQWCWFFSWPMGYPGSVVECNRLSQIPVTPPHFSDSFMHKLHINIGVIASKTYKERMQTMFKNIKLPNSIHNTSTGQMINQVSHFHLLKCVANFENNVNNVDFLLLLEQNKHCEVGLWLIVRAFITTFILFYFLQTKQQKRSYM